MLKEMFMAAFKNLLFVMSLSGSVIFLNVYYFLSIGKAIFFAAMEIYSAENSSCLLFNTIFQL